MSNALTVSKTKNTTKVVLTELQIGRFVKCILSPRRLSKLVIKVLQAAQTHLPRKLPHL